jgi:hypothetical protein
MSRISISKTIWRLAGLGLLLLSSLGPWFADTHPATEETCTAPLVWVGNGYCACIISLVSFYKTIGDWEEWLGIPLLLPILFTLLYFLGGNNRFLWYLHLTGWFLVAVYSLFWFFVGWSSGQELFLWGAGLCGAVAVSLLAWEIRTAKHQPDQVSYLSLTTR